MVRMESTKGYYLYEYVIKPPRQPKRHLQTIFALIPGQVSGPPHGHTDCHTPHRK